MQNDNARERDIQRRLGRVESPEPPVDLLDRIRGDIPHYLRPVDEPAAPEGTPRRPYRLLAASLLIAAVGGLLAYKVIREAPDPAARMASELSAPEATERAPASTEVGDELTEVTSRLRSLAPGAAPAPAPESDPPPAVARERASSDSKAGSEADLSSPPRFEAPAPVEVPAPAVPAGEPEPGVAVEVARPTPQQEQQAFVERMARESGAAKSEEKLEAVGYLGADRGSAAPPPQRPVTVRSEMAKPRPRSQRLDEGAQRREIGFPPLTDAGAAPSTGGTAEPNDQPWGDMFFRPYGTNPFVDTEDDPLSTFALDVDTGSYTVARSYLDRWHLPPPAAIRVEEFVNYFDYDDPAPRRGEFTVTAEGAPSPWRRGPRYQLLRVGLHAREISAVQRQQATLVFVVDVSGSMGRENRLGLVKRALYLLLDQLGPGDRVGLVVYGSRGRVLLEPSGDLGEARRAIERLTTGGSTNAEEGLLLGYDLARRHYRPGAINRLVLCSDGVANVGRTGPESILERIGREADEGIELTTVGFGMGNYNDVLMEQLADRGDGNYAYVDTLDEARRVFVENLTGTLQTVASDAKIQVEFDPRAVTRYRLLGYENRDVADHRFRDDTVDAGEIGAGHRVTALYEIKLAEDASRRRPLAEVRLRYRSKQSGRVVEDSLEVRPGQLERDWRSASPSLKLAALAAELAEVLKRSYWARETRPEELVARARAVERENRGDRDVAELVRLAIRVADLVEWPEESPE